ncbi:GGDEF domain-containing protein [Ideonella oryzae]|uniref:diguanylate cyclase n=1 Tax=Ideonella oryzae TaxID=2937441 RepID=A0ABT1BPK6_9BURK|nr:GGDEF domain-containing protein [Ideonella oryzae]MCO5978151.1 GGDEF domain-containing protein [Ideonella oryzae]
MADAEDTMMVRFAPLTHVLLGPPGPQRVRVSQSLLVLALYLGFALVLQVEVHLGLTSERLSLPLTLFGLMGCIGFYSTIRSGLNLRLSEPSLTRPQMFYSMVAVAWAFAVSGPPRGATVVLMQVILMFGLFGLPPREGRRMAGMGFLMLAAVIAWRSWTLADPAETRLDLVYLMYAGIVFTGVAIISVRLGQIRERLRHQAAELKLALARNQELATRDVLTGLTNRRAMLEQMAIAAREIERHGQPLALVLFDLDHFKQINDSRGHAAGDRVLQRFGEVALAEIRAGDVLARWGGEEFLLMLPRTGLEEAWRCAERIRARLAALKLEGGQAGMPLTFSAGVSSCRRMDQLDAAIEAADRAMYLAKATGRNRTELVAGPGLTEVGQGAAA